MGIMISLAHRSVGLNLNLTPMSGNNLHSHCEPFKTVGTEWFQKETFWVHVPVLPLTTFEILGKSMNILHFNGNYNT